MRIHLAPHRKSLQLSKVTRLTTGPIVGLGGWGGHAPEGVIVCIVRENADTFSTAQKIATTIQSDPTNNRPYRGTWRMGRTRARRGYCLYCKGKCGYI